MRRNGVWSCGEEHRRGGTEVGVRRAEQLMSRELSVSDRDIKSMYSYFARHAVDKRGREGWATGQALGGLYRLAAVGRRRGRGLDRATARLRETLREVGVQTGAQTPRSLRV
jgi:hypothetical protein